MLLREDGKPTEAVDDTGRAALL